MNEGTAKHEGVRAQMAAAKARRWPTNAEAARMDAIALAREISELGQDAKRTIRAGKAELAMVLVSDMQLAAKEIELELVKCKG